VPNDIGNESHDSHDNVRVHRHFEHPGDTLRVQHIAVPIDLLVEERGWLIGWASYGELDAITGVACVERAKPAQAVRTTGP